MSQMKALEWVRRTNSPATLALMGSLLLVSLLLWLTNLQGYELLAFRQSWLSRPWTIVTYPWAYMPLAQPLGLLFFAFLLYWLYFVGTSTERGLGSARFLLYWIAFTCAGALSVWAVGEATGYAYGLDAPYLPVSALTVLWAVRNQATTIMLYGALPVSGRVLGWITAVVVVLTYGFGAPHMGLAACIPLLLAWFLGLGRAPRIALGRATPRDGAREPLKKTERMDERYYEDVKRREKEREERERLRKLFEDSLDDKEG